MFKFFTQKDWFLWSILGSALILSATASIVYIDVQINKWFGEFYDVLQKALSEQGSVSLSEFLGWCYKFAKLAGIYIIVLIFTEFFTSHYTFRWRTAMANYYHSQWNKAHAIEGASQRVQEDTLKFARIMESLGAELLRSIMTLIAFLPILYTLSEKVTELPWFGEFYDVLQKALSEQGSVTQSEFLGWCYKFAKLAGIYIIVLIFTEYFTSHFTFRWRTAMADFYHSQWNKAHSIEGASQRVQEDTLKFARIMESLGAELLRSLMTLIAFTPILWGLSKSITVLPWIGEVEHALVWVALLSALGGTIILASVGIKLPGIEYDIQKEEAAYRKELVLGEDFKESAKPEKITDLYGGVRNIHYKMYFHYLYFNAVKWSYLQGMVIVPYLALAPTIVTGAITLGFVQQIIRAFGRVETSLQYLVRSWPIIVELISVWKRLREFEAKLKVNEEMKVTT